MNHDRDQYSFPEFMLFFGVFMVRAYLFILFSFQQASSSVFSFFLRSSYKRKITLARKKVNNKKLVGKFFCLSKLLFLFIN